MHYLLSTYYVQLCVPCFSNVNSRLKILDYLWQAIESQGPSCWVPIPKIRQSGLSYLTHMSLVNTWGLTGVFLWLNMELLSGNAIVIQKYEAFNFAWHCTKRITEARFLFLLEQMDHSDVVRCTHWQHIKVTNLTHDWAVPEGATYSVYSWNCILQVTCVYLILASSSYF